MTARIVTSTKRVLNWDTDNFELKTYFHLNVIINNYKKGFVYGRMDTMDHAEQILDRYNNEPSFKAFVHSIINEDIEHQAKIQRIKATPYNELSSYEKRVSELF